MRRIVFVALVLLVVSACGLLRGSGVDEEPVGVGYVVDTAEVGDRVHVAGTISLLGDLFCPCFHLTSDGATIVVWYDLMDGDFRAVDIAGFVNGDEATVVGEYRSTDPGTGYPVIWAVQVTPYR